MSVASHWWLVDRGRWFALTEYQYHAHAAAPPDPAVKLVKIDASVPQDTELQPPDPAFTSWDDYRAFLAGAAPHPLRL